VDYQAWERTVPESVTGDVLWRIQAYRLAEYLGDLAWQDASTLLKDRRTVSLADQLYRAIGSIGANIAEGYSRSSGRDRARFLEYALGSARECRFWYRRARHVLDQDAVSERLDCLARIIRLLLVTIPGQRAQGVREQPAIYQAETQQHHASGAQRLTSEASHAP
jgi:four helix bundle protein